MPRSTRYTTRQRAAVLACLKERTGQYLGVQDVADAVKKLGVSVGLTTIYRNLDTLVEEGAVRKFVVDKNSAAVYEYLDDPHTEEFHVKCRACGTLFHLRCREYPAPKLHASDPVGGFTSFVAAPAREEKHFSQEKRHGSPNDQETHEHAL